MLIFDKLEGSWSSYDEIKCRSQSFIRFDL
jgi:hypothetical protein